MSLVNIMFCSNRTFCFSQNQTTYSVACLVTAWLVIIVEDFDFGILAYITTVCYEKSTDIRKIRGIVSIMSPSTDMTWAQVLITSYGFHGGWNGVWVGFLGVFSVSQISFQHFSTLISFKSFHFISPCDDTIGMVSRHDLQYRSFIASHPSTRPCVGHELRIFFRM